MRRSNLAIALESVPIWAGTVGVLALAGAATAVEPGIVYIAVAAFVAAVLTRVGLPALLGGALFFYMTSGLAAAQGVPENLWRSAGALCVAVAWATALGKNRASRRGAADYLLLAFLVLTGVWAGITAVTNTAQAVAGLRAWAFLALLFWVGKAIGADRERLAKAGQYCGLVVIVVLVYGLKQFIFGYTAAEAALIQERQASLIWAGVLRISSTLPTTQDFGGMLFMTLPLLVAALVLHRGSWLTRLALLTLTVLAANLVLFNMVRSAALAAFLGVAAVVFVGTRTGTRLHQLGLVAILALVGFFYFVGLADPDQSEAVSARLDTIASLSSDESLDARLAVVWPDIVDEIKDQPLGHGVATTGGPAFGVLPAQDVIVPDNGYLTLAYELGVAGALLYVAWLASVLRAAAIGARRTSSLVERAVCVGAVGSVVALAAAMMTASFVQLPAVQLILFPLAGAVVAISRRL